MTMTLQIKNSAGPYIARVLRGGAYIATLEPGESVEVACWPGEAGELRIIEVGEKPVPPVGLLVDD